MKLSSSLSILTLTCLQINGGLAWTSTTSDSALSRRMTFEKTASAILTGTAFTNTVLASPQPAFAESVPSAKELSKLQKGHARVRYLLENWNDITEICGKGVMSDLERKQVIRTEGGGGGVCEKSPLKVQDYLGYKSTEGKWVNMD